MAYVTKRAVLQATAAGVALGLMPKATRAKMRRNTGPSEKELGGHWQFRETGTSDWLPATVPGTVHTDLLANAKIPDPFYRTNERDLQWIDKKDWEYRTAFEIDAKTLAEDHIELCFFGLDTYADVYLNDFLILKADNMFRTWVADIKPHVKAGANDLHVVLRSPITEGLKLLDKLGYNPPAVVDWSEIGGLGDKKISMFSRKAPYHYGWDWGPRFVTSGIWRKIVLRAWSGARISDLHILQESLTAEAAQLTAVFEIISDIAAPAAIAIRCANNAAIRANAQVALTPGTHTVKITFIIAKPTLWWCNGLGEPFLYELTGQLVTDRTQNSCDARIGLRTIKIAQTPDANGESFTIELNGIPVFMKGANYIPSDSFLPRVTHAIYERVVRSAADTHMNMLRVWGGGVYEDDAFYDLCDEHGILVWQEFIFACVMYPGDTAFLDNVRHEAVDNVRRLRNHACIALWCGNNEIDTAWQDDVPGGGWGWKEKYTQDQCNQMWAAYKAIFYDILPQVVAEHDEGRFYWPSSPLAAWDGHSSVRHADLHMKKQSGDIHYWGVWWGKLPFSSYRDHIGRFMTEYGFQSFPEFRTIEAFAAPGDYNIDSEVMRAHQRSSIGNGTIATYMARDYVVPKNFREFLYVGQVLQAEGVRIAMEAHRAHRPYCMGSLFWQINDCWPVASWSSIDYYGRWKALQYFARKSFAPDLVTIWLDNDAIQVCVVRDRLDGGPVTLTLRVMDFNGLVQKTVPMSFLLPANTSRIAFTESAAELLAGTAPETAFLHANMTDDGGNLLAENLLYFRPVKDLMLPQAQPIVAVKDMGNTFTLALSSSTLAKNLEIDIEGIDGIFSDNYFDLLPGIPAIVRFTPTAPTSTAAIRAHLRLMHMALVR